MAGTGGTAKAVLVLQEVACMTMKIEYTSPSDRDALVASLLRDSEQWAEVNAEGGRLTVKLDARRSGQPWTFDFDDVTAALLEAKRRLADVGSG